MRCKACNKLLNDRETHLKDHGGEFIDLCQPCLIWSDNPDQDDESCVNYEQDEDDNDEEPCYNGYDELDFDMEQSK
jgi:hypothetical protein